MFFAHTLTPLNCNFQLEIYIMCVYLAIRSYQQQRSVVYQQFEKWARIHTSPLEHHEDLQCIPESLYHWTESFRNHLEWWNIVCLLASIDPSKCSRLYRSVRVK